MKLFQDVGEANASKRHPKALYWDEDEDGHFVTLKRGWAFDDNVPEGEEGEACHVRGFDTVKEALAEIRRAGSCHCARCRGVEQ